MNTVASFASALFSNLRAIGSRSASLIWAGSAICCVSVVFAAVGHGTAVPGSPAAAERSASASGTTPTQPARQTAPPPEVELVTVFPYGFDPPKISRPSGPFIVVIDNRSGLDGLSLTLTRENAPSVVLLSKQLTLSELDGYDLLNLSPDKYILKEAGHPEWSCSVEIAP